MGSTISTAKLAAAFTTPHGKALYVLFEETYESNVFPQRPDWSCIYLGDIEGAIRRIFNHASSCEGGMLKTRSGWIKPEGYIGPWLKELEAPRSIKDFTIPLAVGKGSFATISEQDAEKACATLRNIGRSDLAAIISSGAEASVTLHQDGEVLAALHSEVRIPAWKFIQSYYVPTHMPQNPELGYNPKPAKIYDVPRPRAYRVADQEDMLLQRPDGSWYSAGWTYSIVGDYVRSLAVKELKEPGSYRSRIRAYREAIKSAPSLPLGTKVVVDRTVQLDEWEQRRVADVMQRYAADVTVTGTGFSIITTADNLYQVTHLPKDTATWIIPDQSASFVPQMAAQPVQMSLI